MGSLQGLPEAHFYILIALAEGERHGYSIMQDVIFLTGGKTDDFMTRVAETMHPPKKKSAKNR